MHIKIIGKLVYNNCIQQHFTAGSVLCSSTICQRNAFNIRRIAEQGRDATTAQ
jgi:hypothetical protein